jgi:pimeloyl-ACP methyl ester carboxylesterase
MRITTLFLSLALVLCACGSAATPATIASPIPPTVIPNEPARPTDMQDPNALSTGRPVAIDVGGHSLIIHCYGTGEPVVVLESGMGMTWSYWANLIKGIQGETRVCAYDRSDASHTSQQYAEDLHALLAGTGLKGPYVLVGHSFGGLNVIVYAHQYPQEVAGVMLEDSNVPGEQARWLAVLPPASPNDTQDLKDNREWLGQPHHDVQGIDWTNSNEQAGAVKSLGAIPLIVLTALPPDHDWGNIPADVMAKIDELDQAMQKELTNLSTNSKQIMASTSEHGIHVSKPQEVIDAILQLVEMVRSK